MPEIEITQIPPLQPDERALVEMHSVLNFLNVLKVELMGLGDTLANDPGYLRKSQAIIDQLSRRVRDRGATLSDAKQIEQNIRAIVAEIEETLTLHPRAETEPEVGRALLSLQSAFTAFRAHAAALLARAEDAQVWVEATPDELRRELREVLTAMEHGSHGRFRFVYDPARQAPTDYYVDLQFGTDGRGRLRLPLVVKDVLRDLVANARKYTPPGGRIAAAIESNDARLRLAVRDTGRGIPSDELATVVGYGRRGSNVADVRTMGGGFGLTKAFLVTKQFGGRFWIASELGRGTEVRIEIPVRSA